MEGQCKCGGKIRESRHEVVTSKSAAEWGFESANLPATIEQSKCGACGREMVKVWHKNNLVLQR